MIPTSFISSNLPAPFSGVANAGSWAPVFVLASGSHPAPALPSASRPHAGNRCVLIEMCRRVESSSPEQTPQYQDLWCKQHARLQSRLHSTGGGLSATKQADGGAAFVCLKVVPYLFEVSPLLDILMFFGSNLQEILGDFLSPLG